MTKMTIPNLTEYPKPEAVRRFPKNEAAEKAAISILCQDWSLLDTTWTPDLFSYPPYQTILEIIRVCKADGRQNGDLFALQASLEARGELEGVGGPFYLTDVYTAYPAPSAAALASFRKDLAVKRAYRKALAVTFTGQQDIEAGQADISALAAELAAATADEAPAQTFSEQLLNFIDRLETETPPERFGFGIYGLDEKVLRGGTERKTLAVIAAETSGGKSILLLQQAIESALAGHRVAIYSLEMSSEQVIGRLVSCLGKCEVRRRDETMTQGEMDKINKAVMQLQNLKIHIRDNLSTIEEIESDISDQKAKDGVDFVVVDYIQLAGSCARGRNDNREQQVSEVCRRLKLLSLSQDIAVSTASQLNDDGFLRESRAIGMHADYVLHISHEAGKSFITTKKNRNGERDLSTNVKMIGSQFRFEWDAVRQ